MPDTKPSDGNATSKSWGRAKSALLWAASPSISGSHNNPMEGVMDPIAAIHNGKQQRIRYQNLLEYVRESGGSISAQQLADHQRALKLRKRYVIFFFIAMLFVLSTLSFLPEGFKPFAGILLAAPLTSLIAALLITDRNVVIVRRGKHMSFIKYIFGGFCERTPIKAG